MLPRAKHDTEEYVTLEGLEAGGSTAGAAGLELAYRVALQNRIPGGNNRVILATDRDFDVGPSSESHLVDLIERKRAESAFLTVLGFGIRRAAPPSRSTTSCGWRGRGVATMPPDHRGEFIRLVDSVRGSEWLGKPVAEGGG